MQHMLVLHYVPASTCCSAHYVQQHSSRRECTTLICTNRCLYAAHRANTVIELNRFFTCSRPSCSPNARTYAKFITTSQNKDATESERVKGAAVARALREVIAPFFLRREKQDVLKQQDSSTANDASAPAADGEQVWLLNSAGRSNSVGWLSNSVDAIMIDDHLGTMP